MANVIDAFFQTLVSEMTEATQVLAPTHHAVESIYWDYNPQEMGGIYKTLNVALPADPTNQVVDAGSGDPPLSDISFATVPIVMNKHAYFGYPVRDFEQFLSPVVIRNVFVNAAMTGIHNHIGADVTTLFNTTNFTTNSAISASSGGITTTQFLSGMSNLIDQKVPVQTDPDNMALLIPGTPYTKMMDGATGTLGAAWVQALIAGMKTAEFVRDRGMMPTTYGMTLKLDQQMPVTGAAPNRTFTGAYMHRWAVAGVSRPLPEPDVKVVNFARVAWNNLSLRLMVGYNQWPKLGYIVSIDAGYGLKVVRENMCQLFTVSE